MSFPLQIPRYVFEPAATPAIPIQGLDGLFPVRRIFCVGQNYADHAKEMGSNTREEPFFFLKPSHALVAYSNKEGNAAIELPFPSLTQNLHHEVELVVALSSGGSNLNLAQAQQCIYGYAVGLDMTRRDLQTQLKEKGRPWCISKGFDQSAPISPLTLAPQQLLPQTTTISLQINDVAKQNGCISNMIWNVNEIIAKISQGWHLMPGDIIFTGTPAGVSSVKPGDVLKAHIDGVGDLQVIYR